MTLEQKISLACNADMSHTSEGRKVRESLTIADALEVLSQAD